MDVSCSDSGHGRRPAGSRADRSVMGLSIVEHAGCRLSKMRRAATPRAVRAVELHGRGLESTNEPERTAESIGTRCSWASRCWPGRVPRTRASATAPASRARTTASWASATTACRAAATTRTRPTGWTTTTIRSSRATATSCTPRSTRSSTAWRCAADRRHDLRDPVPVPALHAVDHPGRHQARRLPRGQAAPCGVDRGRAQDAGQCGRGDPFAGGAGGRVGALVRPAGKLHHGAGAGQLTRGAPVARGRDSVKTCSGKA